MYAEGGISTSLGRKFTEPTVIREVVRLSKVIFTELKANLTTFQIKVNRYFLIGKKESRWAPLQIDLKNSAFFPLGYNVCSTKFH